MADASVDSGLGLSEFLSPPTKEPEGEKPSQESQAGEKTEPVAESKEVKTEEVKTESVEEKPVEAAPAEKVEEAKPAPDWDSEDNPYKKQYFDTQRYSTRVNQENVNLKRQFDIINQKLDGTYDPDKDVGEPQADPAAREALVEARGKALASKEYAIEMAAKDGKDAAWVEARIAEFDRTIGQNPVIQARVLASPSPVVEALAVLEERSFTEKWGRNVRQIEEKIRADERKTYEAKIEEEVARRLEERVKNMSGQPRSIREAHGIATDSANNGSFRQPTLDEVLGS